MNRYQSSPSPLGWNPSLPWEAFKALQDVCLLASFPAFSHICSRSFLDVTFNAMGILNYWQFIRYAILFCSLAFVNSAPSVCLALFFSFSDAFPKNLLVILQCLSYRSLSIQKSFLNTSLPIAPFLLSPQLGIDVSPLSSPAP